jgi:putative transposase
MAPLCYRRHRFPPAIIQHAIWLYLRFTLSYRDVEELLAERGLDISYETVRRWVLKFGPAIARRLRQRRPRPSNRWHLDEMVVRIAGKRMYLWRAVDHEGEVLDMLVQRRRDSRAALRLIRKLLRKLGFAPKLLVTDKLRSYAAAFRRLRLDSLLSTQGSRFFALPRRSAVGHEDAFPRPRLSDRSRLGEATFAGTRGNGRDAPIPDLPNLNPRRGTNLTLLHPTGGVVVLGVVEKPYRARGSSRWYAARSQREATVDGMDE